MASAERSFSKLKLIKTYLRSTMSQKPLSGLAVISINHQLANQISYDDIIDDFASKKARKARLLVQSTLNVCRWYFELSFIVTVFV